MAHPSITATTIKEFARGAVVSYLQYNPFLGILEDKGKISTGHSGTSYDWVASVGRNSGQVVEDMEDLSALFVRKTEEIRLNLPWAFLANGCAASKREQRLQGEGTTLYNLQNDRIPRMISALLDDNIAYGIINNDDPTDDDIVGLESIFGYTTGSGKSNLDGTTGGLAASDTYGGHSTALSGLTGVDGAESDAFTPLLVNEGATTWNSSTAAGFTKAKAVEIIQYAINYSMRGQLPEYMPDCGIFNRSDFLTLKEALNDKERLVLKVGDTGKLWGLGSSREQVDVDGLPIFWDQHVAAGNKYILNFDQIGLCVVQNPEKASGDKYPGKKSGDHMDWFDVEVQYEIGRNAIAIRCEWAGQLKLTNPRFQTKIADFTS